MSFIRRYPESIVTALIAAFMIYVLVDGTDKMFRYKFFPYFCVFMITALLIVEWIRTVTVRRKSIVVETSEEPQLFSFDAEYKRRMLRFSAWIAGLFAGMCLVGLEFAAPVFLILFLRLEAQLKWWTVLALTGACWAVTHYLFFNVLGLQIPGGLLF